MTEPAGGERRAPQVAGTPVVVSGHGPTAGNPPTQSRPWEALYRPGLHHGLGRMPTTLLDAWSGHVQERPADVAVFYFDGPLTYRELDAASDALAAALQDHEIGRGDRLALYLQNDPQWLVAMLAGWKIGAIPVAVNPMLRSKELAHHLVDSGATALLCLDSLYGEVAAGVLAGTDVRVTITTHPLDLTPGLEVPSGVAAQMPAPQSFSDVLQLSSVLSQYAGRGPVGAGLAGDDVGMLTYTSGTTGRSKGAMNIHSALVHNSAVYSTWWDLRPGQDVILMMAPVFHITGLVAGFGAGIFSGVPVEILHRFDARAMLQQIEQRGCTFTVGASTAFIALSSHPDAGTRRLSSLTKTPSGGAAVSAALVERVSAATGWSLCGVYGMTETSGPTHMTPAGHASPVDADSGALSVGVPVPGAEARIVDADSGQDLPFGDVGEIVVRGPMVVPGYWQLPEESAHAIRDGWLHTGDIGKMTPEGWLFVLDRLKDMINAGGYKVFPRDVEDVLFQHPAVREAAVVGVPDEYRGETVKAYVSFRGGASASSEELIGYCKGQMAAYKYPRSVVVLDELPKNSSGKILRGELRERG